MNEYMLAQINWAGLYRPGLLTDSGCAAARGGGLLVARAVAAVVDHEAHVWLVKSGHNAGFSNVEVLAAGLAVERGHLVVGRVRLAGGLGEKADLRSCGACGEHRGNESDGVHGMQICGCQVSLRRRLRLDASKRCLSCGEHRFIYVELTSSII